MEELFLKASNYVLTPRWISLLISCSMGKFPYKMKYNNHSVEVLGKNIKLSDNPSILCVQMVKLFTILEKKVDPLQDKNKRYRMLYNYSIKMKEKYQLTEQQRQKLLSLIEIGTKYYKLPIEVKHNQIQDINWINYKNIEFA